MKPTKKQKEAIRLILGSRDPVIWAGAIRSGKTMGGALGLVLHAQSRYGKYIVAGKTYTAVKRNIVPAIQYACQSLGVPFQFKRSEQLLAVNNSEIYLFGANNESSQDYIQGLTADGFLLDELPLLPKSFYMQSIGRCSQPNPFMLATMNKVSPNHWTKVDLIDEELVRLFETGIKDNEYISDETIAMYEKNLSGHYKTRMVDNEWADATGRIWGDIPVFKGKLEAGLPVIASVDAAQSGTTAALFFVQVDRLWYIMGEYTYKGIRSFDDHAKQIAQWNPYRAYVDPSSPGLIHALRKAGIPAVRGNNKVEKGLQAVESAIARKKIYRVEGACPKLLKEMAGYVWDEKKAFEGEDKPVKKDDHHCDALRYFVMGKIPMVNLVPVKQTRR